MAPLLPKLRGHFAEFLDDASSVGLRILSSSTWVGLRYGLTRNYSGFSRQALTHASLLIGSLPVTPSPSCRRDLPSRGCCAWTGYSIPGPRLAPASPHVLSVPGAGISTSFPSATPLGLALGPGSPRADQPRPGNLGYSAARIPTLLSLLIPAFSLPIPPPTLTGSASPVLGMLPYRSISSMEPAASVSRLSPGHFRRGASRPVSCYALFECLAASEPTSWLSLKPHILSHLTRTLGPRPAVWAVSLSTTQLISRSLTPVHHLSAIRSLISFGKL